MDQTLIELIKHTMERRRVNQQLLCQGICDEPAMSRYLSGEKEPDRMIFNALLQRLGISPEHFVTILSSQQYLYFQWKIQVLERIQQSDWSAVEQLLQSPLAIGTGQCKGLQHQFLLIIQGILAQEQNGHTEDAIKYFTQAICLTHPDYPDGIESILDLMSNQEWCALLNLLNLLALTRDRDAACAISLQTILYQLERCPMDETALARIYSYTANLLAFCYFQDKRYLTCEKLCQNAISLLRRNCVLGNLPELMEFDIQCKKMLEKTDEVKEEQDQMDALREVIRNYPSNRRWLLTPMMESGEEIGIWGKLLSQKRKEVKMSKKALCEEICSISTLRNLEIGKCSPGKHTMQLLLKKLDLPTSYIKADFVTTNFRTFDLFQKMKQLSARNDTKEFPGYLNDLKMQLDMSILQNRQWFQFYQGLYDYRNHVLDNRTYSDHILSILKQSLPDFTVSSISSSQLSDIEVLLIIQLARGYEYVGNYAQAIAILEELHSFYQKHGVSFVYQYHKVTLIAYNLAIYYAKMEHYPKSMELLEWILPAQIRCDRTLFLAGAVMEMAHVQWKQGHTPQSKKNYALAAQLGKLFYLEEIAKRSREWHDKL